MKKVILLWLIVIFVFLINFVVTLQAMAEEKKTEKIDIKENILDHLSEKETKKISLNSASEEDLIKLPGIGTKKALAIIKYREKKPFKTIRDIRKIKGIGPKIYNKLKNKICL